MTDEPDNLPDEGGTDNVNTPENDTGIDFDFWEPGDDDPATPEAEVAEPTDEGESETEGQPEEAEAEPEPEEPQPVRADATAKVVLADGTETTVGELAKGHMRQADYTRKTQEVAEQRKRVEADASRIEQITQAFVDHLSSMVPAEPDISLSWTDPAAYTRQKAQHEAAMRQVQQLIELGGQPKQITQSMSEADHRAKLAEENRKLVEMFPDTGTQEGRQKFWGEVSSTAMELGFTAEELQQATDHRLFALAHWARKGMAAEKARAEAKAKVAKAPPVAPQKPGQGARNAGRNVEAMRRLSRTGSIQDAMAVDFD